MRLIIVIDENGEIWFYNSEDVAEDVMLIQPRIKKKEGEAKEDEERTH